MSNGETYAYTPIFDDRRTPAVRRVRDSLPGVADRSPVGVYVFNDSIRLRINLALATGRPLLVRGPSGTGKSSLAHAISSRAGWNFVQRAITSRTQAQDLLYEVDQLKRLRDAQADRLGDDDRPYIRPGPLFWAFDAFQAQGLSNSDGEPFQVHSEQPWVVLLDEIDKADPDVPNNLLVPLGRLEFEIPELALTIQADAKRLPLVLLTTNEERELPPAFLRRCIELVIMPPDKAQLIAVARAHGLDDGEISLVALAEHYETAPRRRDHTRNPAEFLDFVRAWRELELSDDELTRKGVLEAISGRSGDGP